jgi:hypothetical protein
METSIFWKDFQKTHILNFMKIRPVEAELLNADGRTHGERERERERDRYMTKLHSAIFNTTVPTAIQAALVQIPHTRFKPGRLGWKAERAKRDVDRTTGLLASFLLGSTRYRQVVSLSRPHPLPSNEYSLSQIIQHNKSTAIGAALTLDQPLEFSCPLYQDPRQ